MKRKRFSVEQIFAHAEHHLKLEPSPINAASQNMCDNLINQLFIVGRKGGYCPEKLLRPTHLYKSHYEIFVSKKPPLTSERRKALQGTESMPHDFTIKI
ncbi:hypothetical protein [Burkholderia sp. Bp9142]|uniref:hypothetical protein n=1 Tax=Burkholderia sp. Bp9142 TaxID=2184573 RepID=UPI000F59A465|nr:hypothetical protein [Burkholderia sp. Bp9142]RQR25753.1 hypothetical protein DIE22_34540 [Burkholderia sp. Bp9142]